MCNLNVSTTNLHHTDKSNLVALEISKGWKETFDGVEHQGKLLPLEYGFIINLLNMWIKECKYYNYPEKVDWKRRATTHNRGQNYLTIYFVSVHVWFTISKMDLLSTIYDV